MAPLGPWLACALVLLWPGSLGGSATTSDRFPLSPPTTFPDGWEALTPEYARRLWREPLPLPPRTNPEVDLIVSHCREDLRWLTGVAPALGAACQLRVVVYEKCEDPEGPQGLLSEQQAPFHLLRVALPNVGYEGHTFLHHLLTAPKFPDFVFFLQGHDPRVHTRQNSLPLLDLFRCLILRPERYLRNGFRYISDERWEFFTREQACWEGYYQSIFETADCPPVLGTLCCSAFVLTKERIAAVPRGVFDRAMRFLNGSVPPVKTRSPRNAEDHKARGVYATIRAAGFWSSHEGACKTPPRSRLGYCAGAVARFKVEGVQIEHLWQAMLGEPYWLPPDAFPAFEPEQLRSHLWKLKDETLKDAIERNFSTVVPLRYRAQVFSRTQMSLTAIRAHLNPSTLPNIEC